MASQKGNVPKKGNVIHIALPPSIPSRPLMAAERAKYIITNILDPKYKISPPEIPTKCTQQPRGHRWRIP